MQTDFNSHLISIQKLFSDYGIKNITMDDIARSLHISKKTIYKQYRCKDELVIDIYQNDYYHFRALLQSLQRMNIDSISKTIQLYNLVFCKILSIKMNVHFDLEKYYPNLLIEITDLHRKSIKETVIEILFEGKSNNYFHNNIDPYSVAQFFKLLLEVYVLDQISKTKEEYTLSSDDVFDYYFRSVCNPIGLDKWEELKKQNLVVEQS